MGEKKTSGWGGGLCSARPLGCGGTKHVPPVASRGRGVPRAAASCRVQTLPEFFMEREPKPGASPAPFSSAESQAVFFHEDSSSSSASGSHCRHRALASCNYPARSAGLQTDFRSERQGIRSRAALYLGLGTSGCSLPQPRRDCGGRAGLAGQPERCL